MSQPLNQEALDLLFRQARTHSTWLDQPVTDETLRDLYNLMKFGPTSMNCTPARVLFLRTREAKERLRPFLMQANVDKTVAAPVTAIVAYDTKFYERLSELFPHYPGAREIFANNPDLAQITATRNGTLQGGYFIMAARALGLDCGPMSGFDNAKVDAEFFAGEPVKSNFLCNLGRGDPEGLFPRSPRLPFEDACILA